ncbi:MAG: FAD-dependent 5-carboxymethylaminomethyl-2-thiouridine(34) oxidoreductase MnmC [Granulosicoccus sp.]
MPDALPWDQFTNHYPLTAKSAEPVLIIGAGLAGCWMARTLAQRGIRVTVLEAGPNPASGASANPAGIFKPFVTRSSSQAMSFYVQAHQHLLQRLKAWDLLGKCGFNACGVVQLVEKPYPESAHYRGLLPQQMNQILGLHCDAYGLLFEQSGWLNPSKLCRALLQHQLVTVACRRSIKTVKLLSDNRWEVLDNRQSSWRTSHMVICTGAALTHLPIAGHLPITPARGQISRFTGSKQMAVISRVISGKHYLIPDGNTMIIGATFERGVCENSLKSEDNQANATSLEEMLPGLINANQLIEAYAGVRATTPDRLPLVGPIPDAVACDRIYADLHHGRNLSDYPTLPSHAGAFVLGGLGSRGIVTAPFAAELLADHIMGGDEIAQWSSLLNPARFQIRTLKRKTQSPD